MAGNRMAYLESYDTGDKYVLGECLGQGGFGEAFRAALLRRNRPLPKQVCIKIAGDVESWHREAYFGEVLRGHLGAVQMECTFVGRRGRKHPLYCTVFELAAGSVADKLSEGGFGWTERRILSESTRVTEALAALHRSGMVHRDITPMNVLQMPNGHLKLADYGIATGNLTGGKITADAFNPSHTPDTILDGKQTWGPREDVWQLGQLLAMLIIDSTNPGYYRTTCPGPITRDSVRDLRCSDRAKEIMYRCVAKAAFRLRDADEVLRVARMGGDYRLSRIGSLRNRTIVFTGPAPLPRSEMKRLARKMKARCVEKQVTGAVDTVVVGGTSPVWAAGSKGVKLLAALQKKDDGHPIKFISAERFLSLAGKKISAAAFRA